MSNSFRPIESKIDYMKNLPPRSGTKENASGQVINLGPFRSRNYKGYVILGIAAATILIYFFSSKGDNQSIGSSPSGSTSDALSSITGGSTKIEGAFGFSLGDRVPEKSERFKTDSHIVASNGLLKYEITPKIPVEGFKAYYVYVTPTSRKVAIVIAHAESSSRDQGRMLHKEITKRLSKYGELKSVIFDSSHIERFKSAVVEQGERVIAIQSDFLASSPDTYITYYDRSICEAGEAEMETEKKKNSGLDKL